MGLCLFFFYILHLAGATFFIKSKKQFNMIFGMQNIVVNTKDNRALSNFAFSFHGFHLKTGHQTGCGGADPHNSLTSASSTF